MAALVSYRRDGDIGIVEIHIDLATIVAALDRYAEANANPIDDWTVSPLLRRLAASGERLSRWRRDETSGRDFTR